MSYREYDITGVALPYIRTALGDGNTLASMILQKVDFHEGSVATLLPAQIGHDDLGRPSEYIEELRGIASSEPWEWLVTNCDRSVQARPMGLALFENRSFRTGDAIVDRYRSRTRSLDCELYHCALPCDGREGVAAVLQEARSGIPLVGVLTSGDAYYDKWFGSEPLSEAELHCYVKNIRSILMEAYDGDSYMIWKRTC